MRTIAVLGAMICLSLHVFLSVHGQDATIVDQSLLLSIRDAWEANREKVGAIEQSWTIHNTTTEPVPPPQDLPNGGRIIFRPRAKELQLTTMVFRDQFIKRDGNENSHALFFDGRKWFEYSAEQRRVTIRRTDQMPGMQSPDIRSFFLPTIGHSFSDILNRGRITKEMDGRLMFQCDLNSNLLEIVFDRNHELLPISQKFHHPNGSVLTENEMSYRYLPTRDGYIPKKLSTRYYKNGQETASIEAVATSHVEMESPTANGLDFAVPERTRVEDLTHLQ